MALWPTFVTAVAPSRKACSGNNLVDAANLNPYMRITLDIGHFTAYGGEAVKFIRENHESIRTCI